jgi:tetratricopeptide (TPR) repeat protein
MDLIRRARSLVVAGLCLVAAPAAGHAQTAADPYYNFLLGRQLESDGNTEGALAALERAAASDPRSAEVRAEIAALQLRNEKRDAAEKAAKEALALDGANVEANRVLGYVYARAAENQRNTSAQTAAYVRDAVRYLERAASGGEGPADPTLNLELGRLYLVSNEPQKAVQALDRVISQNPYSFRARVLLAQAYASSGDLPKAIDALEAVAQDAPQVLPALAQYQQQAGRLNDAIDTYTRALETQPTNTLVKVRRILALDDAKRYSEAATAAADAARQHPEEPAFPRLQADALSRAGDGARAIQVLEGAAKLFPADSATQLALAGLYSDAGRTADAEKLLRQMIASEPSNANALNHLGYLLARNGRDLDEAIRLVNRALEVEPGKGEYLDSLGWAYFQRGDLSQAEKYLGAAAEQLPENSEIQDHLGDLHAKQGRWADAIAAWRRALDGDGSGIQPAAVQKKIDTARTKGGR